MLFLVARGQLHNFSVHNLCGNVPSRFALTTHSTVLAVVFESLFMCALVWKNKHTIIRVFTHAHTHTRTYTHIYAHMHSHNTHTQTKHTHTETQHTLTQHTLTQHTDTHT